VLSSLGVVEARLSQEYASHRRPLEPALRMELAQVRLTVRVTLPFVVCHTWQFRDKFYMQLTVSGQFFSSEFIDDWARETERWVDAMIAEAGSKASL